MTEVRKVSTREFRNNLAQYTNGDGPIAVMKHGHVVGYYLPVSKSQEAELARLTAAAEQLHSLLEEHGIDEDELVEEFRQLRRQKGQDAWQAV